jgi:chromosome partitioning protein
VGVPRGTDTEGGNLKTIALYNLKGGVGKSTAAVNLACLAASEGTAVLLWDLDPQGAAGWCLRVERAPGGKIGGLLRGEADPAALAVPTAIPGLSVIASRLSYRKLDARLHGLPKPRSTLRGLLEPLADAFDWVFLDCPSGLSLLAENVFQAADCLLVPTIPAPLSVRAWETLVVFLRREGFDARRALSFFSMVEPAKRVHREAMRVFRSREPRVCGTIVPHRADIEAMSASRRPVAFYRPRSPGGQAFAALWSEVKGRITERKTAPLRSP